MNHVTRRDLLLTGVGMAASTWATARPAWAVADGAPRKAAIIGHTGAGNYGHGIDRIFNNLPGIEVVAVADPHEVGRAQAKLACRAARDYADYREMLDQEQLNLVAIGPRWSVEHHAMAMSALRAGAHLYLEKPFTVSLAEADEILHLANQQQRRIAVAHVTRCAPNVLRLEQALGEGLIGELLEIHAVGKMGARAGGQDMMVLGLHVFDLVRLFAGDVQWCHARIRQQGRQPRIADARESPSDRVGPVVGDDIFAQFAMDSGVNVTFRSRAGLERAAGPFGMEIVGSRGVVRLNSGTVPTISWLAAPNRAASARQETWVPWNPAIDDASDRHADGLNDNDTAQRRAVLDWLRAIEQRREPLASGHRAMKAIEMAHGVFQSGMAGRRVDFPLTRRTHPLIASEPVGG